MPRKNGHNLIVPMREPLARPDFAVRCTERPECAGCPYPRHGFACNFSDGSCLKTRFNEIMPPHTPATSPPMFPPASPTPPRAPAQS